MKTNPKNIESMVERQVGRYLVEKKRIEGAAHWRPLVVISRQYGALGAALATRVGELLGFTVWDREILQEMARNSRTSERLLEALDERRRNTIAEMMSVFYQGPHVTADQFFLRLVRVLHTIGQHGNVVIVGRGSQFVFNSDVALRVRVVASLDDRIKGIANRKGLDLDAAREEVRRVDSDRRAFLLDHYKKDPDDTTHYELVVNTTTLGMETAATVVVTAYRSRFGLDAS
ncbi:MAG: AAA family ATPase [Myxococcota bacterium]